MKTSGKYLQYLYSTTVLCKYQNRALKMSLILFIMQYIIVSTFALEMQFFRKNCEIAVEHCLIKSSLRINSYALLIPLRIPSITMSNVGVI